MTRAGAILYTGMPRTGSAWVRSALRKYAGGVEDGPAHGPGTPEPGRTLVGTVRDPWSWYASWYEYVRSRINAVHPVLLALGGGDISFPAVVRGALRHAEGIFYAVPGPGPLYGATMRHLYGNVEVFVPMTGLRESFERLLGRPLPHPPFNDRFAELRTGWIPKERVWDAETVERIAEAEAPWIERFGFAPPPAV